MKPFSLSECTEQVDRSVAEQTLRNRLFRRRQPFVIGAGPTAVKADIVPTAPSRPTAPILELTLNGHPLWAEVSWSDLAQVTATPLEGVPAEDAALILEEALCEQFDAWEALTGTEIRCQRLRAASQPENTISAGVTLEIGERAFLGRLWLSEGASEALTNVLPFEPAQIDDLTGLFLALRLERAGGTIKLADLKGLQPGDALLLSSEAHSDWIALEQSRVAPVKRNADGSVTLTGPFRPRQPLNERQTMSEQPAPAPQNPEPAAPDTTLGDIGDVEMRLSFRLGETLVPVRELQDMGPGMTIPLDRADGDLVDIIVNGQCIGKGEVISVAGQSAVEIRKLFSNG